MSIWHFPCHVHDFWTAEIFFLFIFLIGPSEWDLGSQQRWLGCGRSTIHIFLSISLLCFDSSRCPQFLFTQETTIPRKTKVLIFFIFATPWFLDISEKNKEGDKELTDWERGRRTWSNNKNALDTFFNRTVFCCFVYRDWALLILAIL